MPLGAHRSAAAALAAAATHVGLYALVFALPMIGWAASSAQGHTIDLLGVPLPALLRPDEDLGDELMAWHVTAAWALLALGVLHALAALWHHFVARDAVLSSMLPRRWPKTKSSELPIV